MKFTIDLEQSVIDRIKNNSDYDVTAILNAVDKALSEKEKAFGVSNPEFAKRCKANKGYYTKYPNSI